MSELSPETRAWIDAAGRGDAPRPEDRARIRQRLALQLGTAALASVVTSSAQASALPAAALTVSKTGVGLFGKLALASALAGAVATTAFVAITAQHDSEQTGVTLAQSAGPAKSPALDRVAPEANLPQPIVEQLAARSDPAAAPAQRSVPTLEKRASAKVAAGVPEASIAEELALIRGAHVALRAGHPNKALEQTQAHAARFPRGALREEGSAVEMLARCALGTATSAMREAYLENAPDSPLKTRVRVACQGK